MSTSYDINYDDKQFKEVEADKKQALTNLEKTYGSMINDSENFYKEQVDATKEWEKKQTELQNQQTDFAIQEINQKKDQAKKDYTKEQSGAYQDWQKQSNPYGARAEQIADMGMQNTGYSESSQVAMYTDYQNRVVAARESYSRIVQDFDNDITQARLQNNAALAEIAFNSLQKRLELTLQGFQHKNQLLLEQENKKTELDQMYHERWQDVLAQMNTENALAEEIRQYNESMALEREQFEWQKSNFNKSSGGGGGSSGGGSSRRSGGSSGGNPYSGGEEDGNSALYEPNPYITAQKQLDKALAEGASKDKVANAISNAEKNGVITKQEASTLRETYTPRGLQY